MRKALTVSAIALASSMALAAPAVAFAADAPAPTGHTSTAVLNGTADGTAQGTDATAKDTGTTDANTTDAKGTENKDASAKDDSKPATDQVAAFLSLSASTAKPGDTVYVTARVPGESTAVSVSSAAFGPVTMTEGKAAGVWTGTAVVPKDAKDGDYGVSLTGSGPKGEKLQATANLTVKADKPTPPKPTENSLRLSADHGKPGDRIGVTIKTAEKSASVGSDAFGGTVNLKKTGTDTWTGTAVVAKDVKTGYYGVSAFAGGKKFDTVKFSTDATGTRPDHGDHGDKNHHKNENLKPLDPAQHKKPKGSVNTGEAPAALKTGVDDGLIAMGGASAASAIGLLGVSLVRRRRNHG
ncbi:hypothetical protein [Streptomyces sp. NPDC097619]|uniref:hypothetical protein n=1 Tax=Streptomyces sp. NPDC097619 TaxID=3157228 RepID=UPI00333135F2